MADNSIAIAAVLAERAAIGRYIDHRRATAPIGTEAKNELETVADGIRAGEHAVEDLDG